MIRPNQKSKFSAGLEESGVDLGDTTSGSPAGYFKVQEAIVSSRCRSQSGELACDVGKICKTFAVEGNESMFVGTLELDS